MIIFKYSAINKNGSRCKGKVEADSIRVARELVRARGLTLLNIRKVNAINWYGRIKKTINKRELLVLTRQLAILTSASIPVDEALLALSQQTERKSVSITLEKIRNNIISGYSLSDSLESFPRDFNVLYRALIKSGESSGKLDLILKRLADNIEKSHLKKNKFIQALVYPVILILVSFAVISVLLTAVIPEVIEQFVFMKQNLPMSTRVLMSVSDFMNSYFSLLIMSTIIILIINYLGMRKLKYKSYVHGKLLNVVVIGKVIKKIHASRYIRMLAILCSSGIPLMQSMKIGLTVLTNESIKLEMKQGVSLVEKGASLSAALSHTNIFPPLARHMIYSGEKSGDLNVMLEKTADIIDEEFERVIEISMSIFEPALIIIMASLILFIVLSVLQPILLLNNMA
ncbi:general secretion pathway protein F [Yersinia nurmii]|uniref:General secretion pathway protein F n=1 Tax=Yersinia nurmii TaxID=685706 RepID=A0ABP1YH19_9GAMM|nr:type II secretion system F family protein [Yersinia nurmii]CNE84757.1 general secretion pathway protein F [Yersinia nurmii]